MGRLSIRTGRDGADHSIDIKRRQVMRVGAAASFVA
jgi:hypothetical protein